MSDENKKEIVQGYEIKRAVVFDNDRGIALAENPNAPDPFVTWMFTEGENGARDYEWGHYITDRRRAEADFDMRVSDYKKDYGCSIKAEHSAMDAYKYYSTQRPVDLGTFPKTESGPNRIVNFDKRIPVENGQFRAWGYLEYSYPLTDRQADDYELRSASGNPALWKKVYQQTQIVGKWEKSHRVNEVSRLTWNTTSEYFIKPFIQPERMAQKYGEVMETKARAAEKRLAKKPIAEQLAEAGKQAERENKATPAKKHHKSHEDR